MNGCTAKLTVFLLLLASILTIGIRILPAGLLGFKSINGIIN